MAAGYDGASWPNSTSTTSTLEDGSILVQGKRRKQRTVYLTDGGREYVEAWLNHRGDAEGPLFCPIRQNGDIPLSRMRGESIAYILRRRQEEAGT